MVLSSRCPQSNGGDGQEQCIQSVLRVRNSGTGSIEEGGMPLPQTRILLEENQMR